MLANRYARRALGTCLVAMLLAAGNALAGVKEDVDSTEDARYNAMIGQDKDALAATLADEFVYHQPSGKVQNKIGYLGQVIGGEVRLTKARRYDVVINLYGDVATAMGSTVVDLEMKGKPVQYDLRYLNVWVNRDGRWQLASRQSAFKNPAK